MRLNVHYLGYVSLRCQADHDVQLLQFDIDWVVVLHKENLHFVFEDLRAKKKKGVTFIIFCKSSKVAQKPPHCNLISHIFTVSAR